MSEIICDNCFPFEKKEDSDDDEYYLEPHLHSKISGRCTNGNCECERLEYSTVRRSIYFPGILIKEYVKFHKGHIDAITITTKEGEDFVSLEKLQALNQKRYVPHFGE